MRLDDPDYIGVKRDKSATPGRSGRSSRASLRSVDMAELKNRLRQQMDEKFGAWEKQLRKMQQDYPQSAGGFQRMQQQEELVLANVLN